MQGENKGKAWGKRDKKGEKRIEEGL